MCRELGVAHPDLLTQMLTSAQITEWMAYRSLCGGWGDERADVHAALIARTVAEVNRNPRARKRPYRLEEFLLRRRETRTPEQWVAHLDMIFGVH